MRSKEKINKARESKCSPMLTGRLSLRRMLAADVSPCHRRSGVMEVEVAGVGVLWMLGCARLRVCVGAMQWVVVVCSCGWACMAGGGGGEYLGSLGSAERAR